MKRRKDESGTESARKGKKAGIFFRVARSAVLVYGGLFVLIACGQERYIYYPQRAADGYLAELARELGLERWTDAEGETIGWRAATGPEPEVVVLVFHGNAGFALHRDYLSAAILAAGPGRNRAAALFEYPGYGARPGRPSESVFTDAAKRAFDQLRAEHPDARIFLVGESLGGGVACALAAARPNDVAGLLLITPFNSLAAVARHHFPFLPVGWLLRDRYDNEAALQKYSGPVVVVIAEDDAVVPAALGRRLYEIASGPKRLRKDAGRTHNDLAYSPQLAWWRESWAFLDAPPGER